MKLKQNITKKQFRLFIMFTKWSTFGEYVPSRNIKLQYFIPLTVGKWWAACRDPGTGIQWWGIIQCWTLFLNTGLFRHPVHFKSMSFKIFQPFPCHQYLWAQCQSAAFEKGSQKCQIWVWNRVPETCSAKRTVQHCAVWFQEPWRCRVHIWKTSGSWVEKNNDPTLRTRAKKFIVSVLYDIQEQDQNLTRRAHYGTGTPYTHKVCSKHNLKGKSICHHYLTPPHTGHLRFHSSQAFCNSIMTRRKIQMGKATQI